MVPNGMRRGVCCAQLAQPTPEPTQVDPLGIQDQDARFSLGATL
jgi:hypothetical protein